MSLSSLPVEPRELLARRLTIALAIPIVLLVLLGVALGRQIVQLSEDARLVDQADQVLGAAHQTLLQVIDQETSVRGYQLAHDRLFLERFARATPRDGFARLQVLVADDRGQQARFAEAHRRYEGWLSAIEPALLDQPRAPASTADEMREHLARMTGVREAMGGAIDAEETLLRGRVASLASSTATTKIVFVVLLTTAAALLAFLSRRQLSSIAATFGAALESEARTREVVEAEEWIRAGQARFVRVLQGERTLPQLGADCLEVLAPYAGADVGAFFTRETSGWHRRAGYALDTRTAGPASFARGEGLIGRVAEEGQLRRLTDVPADFLRLRSGTGETSPVELVLVPARLDGVTYAVLELGFLRPTDDRTREMLGRLGESLAFAVRSSEYKQQLRELLEEAHRQAEELQTQQEELRVANEELETQTTALRTTQHQLEHQQTQLERTNDHLVEQSDLLEQQNLRLIDTQAEIAAKAREVERASQFKSDFLSNMSHELRTPLNSLLILSKLLTDNRDGNLTVEQVTFARTIHGAGNDLLALINDILDLSKIESGKMDVFCSLVPLSRLEATLRRTFEPVARDRGLGFTVTIAAPSPEALETDPQRLEQILKNLVSNALKFTERGEVVVTITAAGERLLFAVRDTGIGIPDAHQKIIFEAFRQADGTTSRKYGGTGLGLSISRELARLLGGDIAVGSEVGQGSVFTLSLPARYAGPLVTAVAPAPSSPELPGLTPPASAAAATALAVAGPPLSDRRAAGPGSEPLAGETPVEPGRRTLLVIEDDETFAGVLAGVAREAGFSCLLATTAQRGLALARRHLPAGIILDMGLPDHPGLSVLDRLKRDPLTRHIPVHIISATEQQEQALSMGAAAYLVKPVGHEQLLEALQLLEAQSQHRVRRVLVVDDDAVVRESVASLLGRADVEISAAANASEALALLRERTFDCMVTDFGLPDRSGYELLETMATEEPYSVPPVIVYTGRVLTADEEQQLRKYSRSIIVKGARSPERLLDEVTLFLHQVESELPASQQRLLRQARHREDLFEGRTILVVEDDVRNVFALTSVLEPRGARVAIARNGREALVAMGREPRVDLVLMDVMMPEMDGLEATREIRKNPAWARLPIIALTAKAMADDQQRCLAAGASDYLAKPLDVERLLSLLRVWMPRR